MKQLKLTKPIQAHGEELHVLELREPNYDDIVKFGMPVSFNARGSTQIDGVALEYLPELASIPPSSVKQMIPADLFKAAMLVMSFFTGSAAETD